MSNTFLQSGRRRYAVLPHAPLGVCAGLVLVCSAGLLMYGAPVGASMTHGPSNLTAPFYSAKPDSAASNLAPAGGPAILKQYCTACHGPDKQKGRLALHSERAFLAGGRNGPVFVTDEPAKSEIVRRLRLPDDDDDHMPPVKAKQPTDEQIEVIVRWIADGAPWRESPDRSTSRSNDRAAARPATSPAFVPPPAAIAALRAVQVHVEVIDPQEGCLWVDLRAAQRLDSRRTVALLAPVSEAICDLVLAGTRDTDALLQAGNFRQLRRLDLSHSAVSTVGLAAIARHEQLTNLNLVHTALDDAAAEHLRTIPNLERVDVWRSGISNDALGRLVSARPDLIVNTGQDLTVTALEIEPPIVLRSAPDIPASALIPANRVCPVSGKPVDPRYTVVHKGRLIGLCCPKCAGQVWEVAPADSGGEPDGARE